MSAIEANGTNQPASHSDFVPSYVRSIIAYMSNDDYIETNRDNRRTEIRNGLRLYNTKTMSVEPFKPVHEGKVGIYVCGATVQSSPHIGHARVAVAFDILRRWLLKLGYDVTFVRNVTDIDDKILRNADRNGEPWWALAYRYEREFTKAYDSLGIMPPTVEPRATGHIPDMIDLIQRLIRNGHAYVVNDSDGKPTGDVYFDVSSWARYGELTHQEKVRNFIGNESNVPNDSTVGDAVTMSPSESGKRHVEDFALWKSSKDTDPLDARWDTPFGTGRPGWHIECSAMSHRYLKDGFDIHGGGLDLRFPHHENEMAQTQAAGYNTANIWMHSAWVTVKGEKMSKSLGNGLSVDSVLTGHSAWSLRYALGSVQYRSMLEWSDGADTDDDGNGNMDTSDSVHDRIVGFIKRAGEAIGHQPTSEEIRSIPVTSLPDSFVDAMNDDLNVSSALSVIFSSIRIGNQLISTVSSGNDASDTSRDLLSMTLKSVRAMLDVLGLDPLSDTWSVASANGTTTSIEDKDTLASLVSSLLEERAVARASHDFGRADAIRNQLESSGIKVVDKPDGSYDWSVDRH